MRTKAILQLGLVTGVLIVMQFANTCPAAPAKNAEYTVLEDTMVFTEPGKWFYGIIDKKLYIRDVVMIAQDHATDERVSGKVTLKFDAIWEGDAQVGPIWAYVKLENNNADPKKNGWWEGYCFGARELLPDGKTVRSWFEGTMEGRGIHEGLIARYYYSGEDVLNTGTLPGRGYIVERGAPVRPLKVQATRTDMGMVVPGVYLIPFTPQPIPDLPPTALMYWWIDKGAGNNTHMGKSTDQGFGIFDPAAGVGSGMGYCTAANGDKVYWVVAAQPLQNGSTHSDVNIAGGTDRFEAAVGGFDSTFTQELSSPDPDNALLMQMDFGYTGSGWMRY